MKKQNIINPNLRQMNPVNPGKDFTKPPTTKYPPPTKTNQDIFRDRLHKMNPVNPGKDFTKPPRRIFKPIYPVPTIWFDRYKRINKKKSRKYY